MRHRLAFSAFAVLLAAGVSAAPASAAATAYNTKTQYLTDTPDGTTASSCQSREITLAKGTYHWEQIHDGSGDNGRNITLAAGRYFWEDCLNPNVYGLYIHVTDLVPGSGAIAEMTFGWGPTAGKHTWGSYLDPQF